MTKTAPPPNPSNLLKAPVDSFEGPIAALRADEDMETAAPAFDASHEGQRGTDFKSSGNDGLLLVTPAMRKHLETILRSVGHDPRAAAAGWRSDNPFVPACLFARYGYPVFPCTLFKTPMLWNGFYGATTHLPTLCYWARDKPARGWCVRTGRYEMEDAAAGLWISDVDDAAGYARLAELEATLGKLPKTPKVMSPRPGGGEHHYFAPADSGPDMKTVGKAMIHGKRGGIDQKGRGGYAVIAGSLNHKSRKRYFWAEGCAPDETPLATLPPAWVQGMDKADTPAPKSSSSRTFRASPCVHHIHDDSSSMILGDGREGGGFHGPINRLAVRYFFAVGPNASTETLIAMLRKLIEAAPKSPDRDISRYLSAEYLTDAVESARNYVKEKSNVH